MSKSTAWLINNQKIPVKLKESTIDLEKNLETWIASDPSLVQGGLVVVGRQLILDSGRLDLLAIDPQGRWVVIEIKAGVLDKEVITQALYYVSQIATMKFQDLEIKVDAYLKTRGSVLNRVLEERGVSPENQAEERETLALIVGTGRTPGLNKMLDFLTEKYEVPLTAVVFDTFELPDGHTVITREVTESDFSKMSLAEKVPQWTIQDCLSRAKKYGIGDEIRTLLNIAEKYNLHTRPYANSIMFSPQNNKTRMLFTVWLKPNKKGEIRAYIGSDVFAAFYPVSENVAVEILGNPGWRFLSKADVFTIVQSLEKLFQTIERTIE